MTLPKLRTNLPDEDAKIKRIIIDFSLQAVIMLYNHHSVHIPMKEILSIKSTEDAVEVLFNLINESEGA